MKSVRISNSQNRMLLRRWSGSPCRTGRCHPCGHLRRARTNFDCFGTHTGQGGNNAPRGVCGKSRRCGGNEIHLGTLGTGRGDGFLSQLLRRFTACRAGRYLRNSSFRFTLFRKTKTEMKRACSNKQGRQKGHPQGGTSTILFRVEFHYSTVYLLIPFRPWKNSTPRYRKRIPELVKPEETVPMKLKKPDLQGPAFMMDERALIIRFLLLFLPPSSR